MNIKKQEMELLNIYEKLSPLKQTEVLDFARWMWRERPKREIYLKGALGKINITDEDIEDAQNSIFPYEHE